jgi:hypothetical protein
MLGWLRIVSGSSSVGAPEQYTPNESNVFPQTPASCIPEILISANCPLIRRYLTAQGHAINPQRHMGFEFEVILCSIITRSYLNDVPIMPGCLEWCIPFNQCTLVYSINPLSLISL